MSLALILWLLTAAAIILTRLGGAWLTGGQCAADDCLRTLLQHWLWLSYPARTLFCLVPVLLLVASSARRPRLGAVFRGWPLYFFLALLALLIGLEFLYAVVGTAMAGSVSALDALSPLQRLSYVAFFSPPLLPMAAVLMAWWPVSRWCFAPASAANPSRGARALFAYVLFAALAMAGLGWAHLYLMLFTDTDYMRWVDALEHTTGIAVSWSILVTPIIMALPVWAIAWWRDPGEQRLGRLIPVVFVALLLSLIYALIGLLAAVLLSSLRSPQDMVRLTWGWSAWILVVNALATWMAYFIFHGRSGRSAVSAGTRMKWSRAVLAVGNGGVAVLFFGVVGVIAAGKLGWTGSQPPRSVAARDTNLAQIGSSHGQPCDGVVRAGDALWYVGHGDFWSGLNKLGESGAIQKLADLVVNGDGHAYRAYSRDFTVVSRLTPDGRLEPRFYVRGRACLIPVPGSARLLLKTSLQRTRPLASSITFESMDDGRHWRENDSAAFAGVDLLGAHFQVDFLSPDELWLTSSPYGWRDEKPYLAWSGDGGSTVHPVVMPEGTIPSLDEAARALPDGARIARDQNSPVIDYLTYLSSDKAVLWATRKFGYELPVGGEKPEWHQAARTDQVVLERHGDRWAVDGVRPIGGLYIDKLARAPGGPAYALLNRGTAPGQVVARLNEETLHWEAVSALPNPFWPLGHSSIRNLWVSQHVLVVEVEAVIRLPRWAGGRGGIGHPTISANAYYDSRDGGGSWHKLAIDRYPGVLGLDGRRDRLYFQNLNIRSEHSPMYAYDLGP